jgi:hypothetical protein
MRLVFLLWLDEQLTDGLSEELQSEVRHVVEFPAR